MPFPWLPWLDFGRTRRKAWMLLGAALALYLAGRWAFKFWLPDAPPSRMGADETVDVNRADSTTLQQTPGLTPHEVKRIIAVREREGGLDDRQAVEAIVRNDQRWQQAEPHIHVGPKPPEPATTKAANNGNPQTAAKPAKSSAKKPAKAKGLVDLNQATQADLEAVNGIGPVTAQDILAKRQAAGGQFGGWAAVYAIDGIGPKTLKLLKANFCLGEECP